jgi:NAD(P)-dependent dehydrogenase (short-subunit alcohol dehydrogenase family)
MRCVRSSKSALHGLIHWLANTYAPHGITVNGVAPALIAETKMLPGIKGELAKSTYHSANSKKYVSDELQKYRLED